MGLVGGAPLLVLIAPHLCRRQQSMPPLQRTDPAPADANSASRHASRRGLAAEGGSPTPDDQGPAFWRLRQQRDCPQARCDPHATEKSWFASSGDPTKGRRVLVDAL